MIKDFFNNLKSYSSNQPTGFKNILENLDDEHRSKENIELILCSNAYEACKDTKAIIIGTEWNEFRSLDLKRIKSIMYFLEMMMKILNQNLLLSL